MEQRRRNEEEKEVYLSTWRSPLSIGRPHSCGLAIGLSPALASRLASASSKAKMATSLSPLVSQWPPRGEACAGAVAPRGVEEGGGGDGEGGERREEGGEERRGRQR